MLPGTLHLLLACILAPIGVPPAHAAEAPEKESALRFMSRLFSKYTSDKPIQGLKSEWETEFQQPCRDRGGGEFSCEGAERPVPGVLRATLITFPRGAFTIPLDLTGSKLKKDDVKRIVDALPFRAGHAWVIDSSRSKDVPDTFDARVDMPDGFYKISVIGGDVFSVARDVYPWPDIEGDCKGFVRRPLAPPDKVRVKCGPGWIRVIVHLPNARYDLTTRDGVQKASSKIAELSGHLEYPYMWKAAAAAFTTSPDGGDSPMGTFTIRNGTALSSEGAPRPEIKDSRGFVLLWERSAQCAQ
jgi:hypothetical protein